MSLKELEKRALKELEILNYPPQRDWIPQRKTSQGEKIYDVVIIGGGQTGTALALALRREKIDNILLFDECPKGKAGPWLTYARMPTLRTPKYTLGPDCDVPSLTFQAWYEAQHGEEGWKKIDFVPRLEWGAYLKWLQNFLNLPILHNTKVEKIEWLEKENCFQVHNVHARKVILATGLQGSGIWWVPEHIRKNIPKPFYDQISEEIDFSKYRGKKVGILGAGPCAFDNALMCSDAGASEVHIFSKKPKLVNLHVFLWGEYVGFLKSFPGLDDAAKWKFVHKMYEIGQPPTPQGVKEVRNRKNIFFHYNSPWIDSKMMGGKPTVITPKGEECLDALIVAIGWTVDLQLRPELNSFRDKIALWKDKYTPPKGLEHEILAHSPYLGKGSNFTEKREGSAPYLRSIFSCTGGSLLSTGFNAGTGLTGMKYSIKNVIDEIVDQFFIEDAPHFYHSLETYDYQIFNN